jgi:hypothetical protein
MLYLKYYIHLLNLHIQIILFCLIFYKIISFIGLIDIIYIINTIYLYVMIIDTFEYHYNYKILNMVIKYGYLIMIYKKQIIKQKHYLF